MAATRCCTACWRDPRSASMGQYVGASRNHISVLIASGLRLGKPVQRLSVSPRHANTMLFAQAPSLTSITDPAKRCLMRPT
ncbi:hypothetical protein G6F46_015233 [Rhizopus delemar]|nr:hypothetical protein G6F46_015233 [Rhizopus delemar]